MQLRPRGKCDGMALAPALVRPRHFNFVPHWENTKARGEFAVDEWVPSFYVRHGHRVVRDTSNLPFGSFLPDLSLILYRPVVSSFNHESEDCLQGFLLIQDGTDEVLVVVL
jgi:hypothetical protein